MIERVGALTGREDRAQTLSTEIRNSFRQIMRLKASMRTAYLIWQKSFMAAGGETFISDMLLRCGLDNVFQRFPGRYPEITAAELSKARPELILLSSEPFPFGEKHCIGLQQQFPGVAVMLVDGEMFSWYGSRMLEATGYFQSLIKKLQRDYLF